MQLDPNFALAWARLCRGHAELYFRYLDRTDARRDAARKALENAQKLEPNSPETLLALGYYQYWVLRDFDLAKTTFSRASKMLPGNSEVPLALARVARRQGHWDQSIAYFEQALTLDPRNLELVTNLAETYALLRQFPAALKLYNRILDITPNDPSSVAAKAAIYQAQGNLPEAARLLPEINWQTPSNNVFLTRLNQLRLERNYGEAIRLLEARLAQFHFSSEETKADDQVRLAWIQGLAGDTAGAKATAEQARNTLEALYKDRPDDAPLVELLSQAYAAMGERDSAIKLAEQAIMLMPVSKDPLLGPSFEETLALLQTMFGENSRAISALTRLLQTPYNSFWYDPTAVTPALLRLDPLWDPLRSDPAFQKLCEEKIDKSIAVLPFENLSREPDNAYFAEGIQEEILTRLANIADLKVISRTSTQRYKSKPDNLADIAKQLGVAHILEGSVQKAGDQVRVNVQLINAETDSHLWAESFDRKLIDIFEVESEIAKRIAESLQAKLTGREQQALAVKPTNNPEAYDAYLRGLAFDARPTSDALVEAAGFYERAVQLDPNFATAWARLSRADAHLYLAGRLEATSARRDAAKRALENAQKLEPNSPETLLALGYYQYWVMRDYGPAKTSFSRAGKMSPSNNEVPWALARVTFREEHWDQSIAYFEQALALNPRNLELLTNSAEAYAMLRQFPAALKLYDRVLDITPNDLDVMAAKARIYQAQGNLPEAARLLSEINWQTPYSDTFVMKILQLRLERNYGEAIRLLQARLAQFHFDDPNDKGFEQNCLAEIQRLAGDTVGAKATAEQPRNTFEQAYGDQLDKFRALSPRAQGFLATDLSTAYALIGEKDLAIKTAERAIILDPTAAHRSEENLASILTMFGENGRAISILTQLLQTPYGPAPVPITRALLRLDPIWDPLRGDPAFQKLCEEKQGLTANGH